MPRSSAIKRADERRANKRTSVTASQANARSFGSLFERFDSIGSVVVVVAGCCLATGVLVRHTVFLDYKASLDAQVRIVANNVATCVGTGRGLDARLSVPLCVDPVDGSAVPTDQVPFPAAKARPPAKPAADVKGTPINAANAKPKAARSKVSPVVLAFGRTGYPLFPTKPPVLRIVATPQRPAPKPSSVASPVPPSGSAKAAVKASAP